MVKLIWTEMSIDDLNNIADYIEKDSPYYARDFVKRIIGQVEKLPQYSEFFTHPAYTG